MIVYVLSIEISVSFKGIQIFKYSFVAKLILFLRERVWEKKGSKSIVTLCTVLEGIAQHDTCTYCWSNHARTLQTKSSDCLEDIHHTLRLESLNEQANSYVSACSTTPTTTKGTLGLYTAKSSSYGYLLPALIKDIFFVKNTYKMVWGMAWYTVCWKLTYLSFL